MLTDLSSFNTHGYFKVLPSFRPLINKYKFSYYDDVIQCYITGNNSPSYSGY